MIADKQRLDTKQPPATISMTIGAHQTLVTAGAVLVILLAIALWQLPNLTAIYSSHQVGEVGWVLNGLVVTLFFVGLIRLVMLLVATRREEQVLLQAIQLAPTNADLLPTSLPADSMIGTRLATMQQMYQQGQPVQHDVLASTLVAHYGSNMTLPRFVNNSLILCGVFGTIVSLSMALVGASDLLNTVNSSGMGLVIHGMSTALSTTMTAIVCYLYFTWLLHSVADVETRLLASMEAFTAQHLMPLFHVDGQSINHQLAELLLSMGKLVQKMETTAAAQPDLIHAIALLREQQQQAQTEQSAALQRLATLLQQGFRIE